MRKFKLFYNGKRNIDNLYNKMNCLD